MLAWVLAFTTSTPADTATPTAPKPALNVSVRISSRFVAVTARPYTCCVARPVVRSMLTDCVRTSDDVPSFCRSRSPVCGALTWPAFWNDDRSPETALVLVSPLLDSIPSCWSPDWVPGVKVEAGATKPVSIPPVATSRP